MTAKAILAVVLSILLGVQAVRTAAVNQLAETGPPVAALWSGHPAAELAVALTEMAQIGRQGSSRVLPTSKDISDVERKEPLAAEPFVLAAIEAQIGREDARAHRLFEAAQWRDPRSVIAARSLAEWYLRNGDLNRGLSETGAVARLAGPDAAKPYVEAYAGNPHAWPMLRTLFQANPSLRDATLMELASKPQTVATALALAEPGDRSAKAPWFGTLLETLTSMGDYEKAHELWAAAAGSRRDDELLHDASFSDSIALPPFNWSLTRADWGLAERQAGGRLHVAFDGREDGFLASQLMLLPAGSYVLTLKFQGDSNRTQALSWSVWCDTSTEPLVSSTVGSISASGLRFVVPATCRAQWLRLGAASFNIPRRTDVMIYALKLSKAGAGA